MPSSSSTSLCPMVGLAQLGNSCYLNSVVQSLYLTDDFRSSLTSLHLSPAEMKRFATLRSLQHLFGLLMYCSRPSYSPKAFRAEMPETFKNGTQQDADEFAKHLLETIHSQWKELQAARMQGSAKRKAEESEVEGQPEHKVAAVAAVSERSSSPFSPSPPPPATDGVAMVDVVAERPPSLHGPIRGGGESSSPVLLSNTPKPMHLAPSSIKPDRSQPSMSDLSSAPLPASSAALAALPLSASSSSSSSSLSASSSRAPPPSSPGRSPSPSSTPPQHDLDPQFGGVISSCITCLRCGHASVKEEAFLELPLPMQQMDEEQRAQLHDRIDRAKEQAQTAQPTPQQQQQQQPPVSQATTCSTQPSTYSVHSSSSTSPCTSISSPSAYALAVPAKMVRAPAAALPDSVLAKIMAFADVGPGQLSKKVDALSPVPSFSTRHSPSAAADVRLSAQALLQLRSLQSSSASASSSAPSILSSASASVAVTSSTLSSSALSPPSTSSSPSLSSSASPAPSPSSPSALLMTFLAQAVLQTTMQASLLTTITTLTTAAALAHQQQQQQQQQPTQPLQQPMEEKDSPDEEVKAEEVKEDKSTALVLYIGPPHLPTASSSTDTALITTSSASSSSSSLLSLSSMLDLYLSPELLIGDNAYHCSHCASKQSATLSCSISSPPPHLLIALKRNEYDSKLQCRTKLMTEVQFPAFLHLPSPSNPGASYALYSVVVHSGLSADSGHYYTIGRRSGALRQRLREELRRRKLRMSDDPAPHEGMEELARGGAAGEFFNFNDESVTSASFATIRQVTKRHAQDVAYLLLYVRVDGEEGQQQADSSTATVNPLLMRLAELEQATFVRLQEKERREAMKKAEQLLVPQKTTLPDYHPPAEGWTDPDM